VLSVLEKLATQYNSIYLLI